MGVEMCTMEEPPGAFKEELRSELLPLSTPTPEKIIARRVRSGTVEYYVKWAGCTQDQNTWELKSSLNCDDIIDTFENSRNDDSVALSPSNVPEDEGELGASKLDESECDPEEEEEGADEEEEEEEEQNETEEESEKDVEDEIVDALMNIKKEKNTENSEELPQSLVKIMFVCEVCEDTFSDKNVLRLHKLAHKREQKLFNCSKCSFTCNKKLILKRHVTSEHTEDKIDGFVRLRKSKIIAESSSEDEDDVTAKSNCTSSHPPSMEEIMREEEKRTRGRRKRRRKVNTRVESSSDEDQYVDDPDDRDDDSPEYKEHKLNHMLTLMLNPSGDPNSLKCRFCVKELKEREHDSQHPDVKKYECKECRFTTYRRATLKRHQERYHNTKLFRCNICTKSYTKKNDLKVHRLSHENRYPCEICQYFTHKKSILMEHMRKKHTNEQKLLACTTCNFTSKYKATLVAHMSIHTGEYKFNCEHCDYKTSNPTLFKAHMLRHSSTTFYKCDQCPYETRYKGDLSHHVKTHSNLKPFCCTECSFTTRTNRLLQRHMEKHFQEKSFACSECPFKTREKRALRRHLKRHAGGKTYKCSLCTYGSNTLVQIKRHNTRHHGGVGRAISGLVEADVQDLTVSKEQQQQPPPLPPHPQQHQPSQIQVVVQQQPQPQQQPQQLHPQQLLKSDVTTLEEKYHIDVNKKKLMHHEEVRLNQPAMTRDHLNPEMHNNMQRHPDNQNLLNPNPSLPVSNPNDYLTANKYPTHHPQPHPPPPNSNFSVMDMNFSPHFLNYNVQPSLAVSQNSSFPVTVPGFNPHFMNPTVLSHNPIQHPTMPTVDMNLGFHGMPHDQNSQSSDMLIPITTHNMDYNTGFTTMNPNLTEPYNPNTQTKTDINRIYDNKPRPKKTIRRPPGTGNGEEVTKPYACDECQFRSKCITNLTIHKRIHTGERPFPCKLCHKRFVSNSQLLRHERVHSAERPYSCDQCDKNFNRKEILNKHRLVHSRVKDFKCDQCKYATHRKDYLVEHKLKHSTERPYACDTCPYRTNRKYLLPKHKKMCTVRIVAAGTIAKLNDQPTETNTEIIQQAESLIQKRVYKCVYCEFTTKTNKDLNKHMEIHSAEKHGGKLVIQLKYPNQEEDEELVEQKPCTGSENSSAVTSSTTAKRGRLGTSRQPVDHTDSFGQNIATKLKNLPENMREQTEQLLIDLLMKAEQGQVN